MASSERTVRAVWQNYPALHQHFTNASLNEIDANKFLLRLADNFESRLFVNKACDAELLEHLKKLYPVWFILETTAFVFSLISFNSTVKTPCERDERLY